MKVLIDTNILADLLNGIEQAYTELKRFDELGISIVTWMELLVGTHRNHEGEIRSLLSACKTYDLTAQVAERAVELRREHRLKLPDAIIWATALSMDRILVTRNDRDFPAGHPGIRIPYRLTLQ